MRYGSTWTTLGKVLQGIEAGRSFQSLERAPLPGEYAVLKVSSISWNEFDPSQAKALSPDFVPPAAHIVKKGDFLLSRANTKELVGAAVLVTEDHPTLVLSDKSLRLNLNTAAVLPEFVLLGLRLPQARSFIEANATGASSSMRNLSQEKIGRIPIPVPSLDTQKSIVATLKEQIGTTDSARIESRNQKAELQKLAGALLRNSLAAGGTRQMPIAECLVEISKGVGEFWNSYPVLGATRAGLAPAKEGVGKYPQRYKLVDEGTIFYNPMRILLGSIAMIDSGEAPGITSPDYVVFKCRPNVLHHRWLYHWLRSHHGEVFIKGLTRGAVRERLLFKRLAKASIEVPSIEVQREFADRVPLIQEAIGKTDEQIALIEKLPAAYLRRAFAGQL